MDIINRLVSEGKLTQVEKAAVRCLLLHSIVKAEGIMSITDDAALVYNLRLEMQQAGLQPQLVISPPPPPERPPVDPLRGSVHFLCALQVTAANDPSPPLVTPIGTAFCFSSRFALSANHNRFLFYGSKDGYYHLYYLVTAIRRVGTKAFMVNPIPVTVHKFNVEDDWVVFTPQAADKRFDDYLRLAPARNLPDSPVPQVTQYIRSIYAPVNHYFQNAVDYFDLKIMSVERRRVQQYLPEFQPGTPVEEVVMVSEEEFHELFPLYIDTRKVIMVDGSLPSGACGSPYIDAHSHEVVAFHLYSGSAGERKTVAEILTLAREQARALAGKRGRSSSSSDVSDVSDLSAEIELDSVSGCHPSRRGLVIARTRSLVVALRAEGIELNQHLV